jgi:predicted GNAT family acetyltransferase
MRKPINNMEIKHSETETKGLFEVMEDGKRVGEMTYSKAGTGRIIIDHTQVDPSQNGKGLGRKLVDAGVAFARENSLKILPLCPFAKKVLTGSAEYQDVLS